MKKISCLLLTTLMMICIFCYPVRAANELEFELNYTGDIILNQTKGATVILRGTNATTYAKVRVNVEVTGPSTPKIIATDSLNQEIDIAQTGYWGPEDGFPVSGTFENETPVKVTFDEVGKYSIKLTLVNMENSQSEIISKTFDVEVLEDETTVNEVVENTEANNTIEKLPQTGTSITEIIIYAAVILALVALVYFRVIRK